MAPDFAAVERRTLNWVSAFVLDLNLCPFAAAAMQRLRIEVSGASTTQDVLRALQDELQGLDRSPHIETVLLVLPRALPDFMDYNDFLDDCDALLSERAYEGVYQIASFHPAYQFANTQRDDAENYVTRSPYPMLHLLREDSVSHALERYPDTESIAQRNILRLRALGTHELQRRLTSCLQA